MKPVLVVGELNLDLVFGGCHGFPVAGRETLAEAAALVPGSSSMICALGLARLGTPVAFAGVAGDDAWGLACVDALRQAGVDVARVRRDPALHTGITAAFSTRADRALVTFPGSMAALRAADIDDAWLATGHHLHVSSYYLQRGLRPGLAALFRRAHAAGLSTSLDPGHDPDDAWGDDWHALLAEVDVFLPNEAELAAISRCDTVPAGLRALANGHTLIVAKRGAHGCAVLDEAGAVREVPGFSVATVDSTGAGDSFDAGFLHAWTAGQPLTAAMRWGNACGALSTRGAGGTAAQAGADEVRALLEATR